MSRRFLAGIIALGAGAMLGLAGRGPAQAPAAASTVLWVHADPGGEAAALRVAPVAGALLSALIGEEIEPALVDVAPDLGWWSAEDAVANGIRIGFDLNALRADRPEFFDDQSLNQALLELGLANARGVVLECSLFDAAGSAGGAARVTVSFRDWDAGRAETIPVSPARTPDVGDAGAARIAIRPAWQAWIDSLLGAHRSMLEPLHRSTFDVRLESWERRHDQKLRQVTASLEGPIVIGASGEEGYALIGIGPRADVGMLTRNLGILIGSLGEASSDPRGGGGTVRLGALAGTEFERLEWRMVEAAGRRWLLVTRAGFGESVAAAIAA